jgi:hypothetical protein
VLESTSSAGYNKELTCQLKAFENTSTNVAAAQMRNALTQLSETVKDPEEKKVSILGPSNTSILADRSDTFLVAV